MFQPMLRRTFMNEYRMFKLFRIDESHEAMTTFNVSDEGRLKEG